MTKHPFPTRVIVLFAALLTLAIVFMVGDRLGYGSPARNGTELMEVWIFRDPSGSGAVADCLGQGNVDIAIGRLWIYRTVSPWSPRHFHFLSLFVPMSTESVTSQLHGAPATKPEDIADLHAMLQGSGEERIALSNSLSDCVADVSLARSALASGAARSSISINRGRLAASIGNLFLVASGLVAAYLLHTIRQTRKVDDRMARSLCETCGYPLGAVSSRCPECGQERRTRQGA